MAVPDAAAPARRCAASVPSRLRAGRAALPATPRVSPSCVSPSFFTPLSSPVAVAAKHWFAVVRSISTGPSNGGSDKCVGIQMDSLITAAARALAAGDPLGALNRIALRDDAPALALRGIAMAQLGDLVRAKALVRRAARAFGPREAVARARCIVAEAEIALASRDLGWPAKALDAARAILEARGDSVNAAHARLLEVRRLLLVGRLDEAERKLAKLDPRSFPPALRAIYELVVAGIAMRRIRTRPARAALDRAEVAARRAGIPPLIAEVEAA